MKNVTLPIILFFLSIAAYGQSAIDTLTNEKIIQLSKIGLEPSVIIGKIQTSAHHFDVSTDALINLSSNGVAPDVIKEMMKVDSDQKTEMASQKDMRDPKTMRSTGIYHYTAANADRPLRRVEPAVISEMKTGGIGNAIAKNATRGLAKSKLKSSLAGAKSRLQIDNNSPEFYFYFGNDSKISADNWFFASATSPNEFILVKLDEKKDSRELEVGSENAFGSSVGIDNKDKIPFNYDEVSDGIYKVTFKEPLKKGEYCFLYGSATPTSYSNDKVFDFGIQVGK